MKDNAHLAKLQILNKQHLVDVSARHLGLARASDRAVGAASGSGRAVGLGSTVGSVGRWDLEVAHVDERLLASVAAGAASLDLLLVGGDVETDEQEEVRGDNGDTSESSEFLTGALAHVGSPGEVGGGEVGVRGEVDET